MTVSRSLVCTMMLAALATATAASGSVVVSFDPAADTVNVGEFVDVDVVATFDSSIVGWGLDLTIEEPAYAGLTDVEIGPAWDPATQTLDGDLLAGLVFPPGLTGEVLLATLTFEGLSLGTTDLTLSYGDEDEGFQLEVGGLDTDVTFNGGSIEVVPEPATMALLLAAAAFGLRRRC